MRLDQYSSYFQIAAALSLAGWVARTPDSNADPSVLNSNYGYQQSFQNQLHHPHGANVPQWNRNTNQEFQNQYCNVNDFSNYQHTQEHGDNPIYHQQVSNHCQSKDAVDSFRASVELQELLSWQETFRRGDFGRFGTNYVFPVNNKESKHVKLKSASSNPSDDGYMSGDASVQSPAPSVFSSTSSSSVSGGNFEDINSPFPEQQFVCTNSELPGAVGGEAGFSSVIQDKEDFDIDDILFGKDSVKPKYNSVPTENNFHGSLKTPMDNLKTKDDDLEFVNSPLKSPSFDEFLGSPNPGQNACRSSVLNTSVDDQFQMHFTNASVNENKFLSNPLVDLDNIDPAIIDEALACDEQLDKALVDSLSGKEKHFASPNSPVIPYRSNFLIKNQRPRFSDNLQHVFEQEFNQFKQETGVENYVSKTSLYGNLMDHIPNPTQMINPNHRQFASNTGAHVKSPQGKLKKQVAKMTLIWTDFPYTQDELIEMPVEKFNEVIKTLDGVRQHEAKDIRRKGKNKLAARNCRKRKMDVIDSLDSGVENLEKERCRLLEERQRLIDEKTQLRKSTRWLNDYIFQHLRDANGSPYSSSEYSLQYTSDGNVYLVPSGPASQAKSIVNVK